MEGGRMLQRYVLSNIGIFLIELWVKPTLMRKYLCTHKTLSFFQVNLWILSKGFVFFSLCTSWIWHKWVSAWLWYLSALNCAAQPATWSPCKLQIPELLTTSLSNWSTPIPAWLKTVVQLNTCVCITRSNEIGDGFAFHPWQLATECVHQILSEEQTFIGDMN